MSKPTRSARVRARGAPAVHAEDRILPGTMIASRYRVVALVGRGGMGEVHRADDLFEPGTDQDLPY